MQEYIRKSGHHFAENRDVWSERLFPIVFQIGSNFRNNGRVTKMPIWYDQWGPNDALSLLVYFAAR